MIHLLSRILLCAVLVLAAVATGPSLAHGAGSSTTISVAPSSVSVDPGDIFSVEYRAANVPAEPGIGGYVLSVKWNPAILEMTSFSDSGWVTSGNNIVICGAPIIDNAAGQAVFFCAPLPLIFGPGVSTTEPRAMASSTFRARASGTTALDLEGSYVEGPANEPIPATLVNGSVTVRAQPTATPAPPTATPVAATPPAGSVPPADAGPVDGGSTDAAPATLSNIGPPRVGSPAREETTGSTVLGGLALTAVGAVLLALGIGVRRNVAGLAGRKPDQR